ncbi:MAG: 50S ribosomal protein L9 [Planctomycetes bacterium]|nr:50S ribosomal protein L9 [Planctomycetota bacterium]
MEVLLKTDIEKLGRLGDVVTVRTGYARNYLLPTGRAVLVTKANLANIERDKALKAVEEQQRVAGLKQLAESIGQSSVTIEGKASESGHLFGSVSAAQIAAAMRAKGLEVDDKMVRLDAPLKEISVYDVRVHLHAEVEATIKVWVVQAKPE